MGLLEPEEREALARHAPEVRVWDENNNEERNNSDNLKQSNVKSSTASIRKLKKSFAADSFVVHNKYGMGGNESEEEDTDILE